MGAGERNLAKDSLRGMAGEKGQNGLRGALLGIEKLLSATAQAAMGCPVLMGIEEGADAIEACIAWLQPKGDPFCCQPGGRPRPSLNLPYPV